MNTNPSLTTIEICSLIKLYNVISKTEINFLLKIPNVHKDNNYHYRNVFNAKQLLILQKHTSRSTYNHLCSIIVINRYSIEALQKRSRKRSKSDESIHTEEMKTSHPSIQLTQLSIKELDYISSLNDLFNSNILYILKSSFVKYFINIQPYLSTTFSHQLSLVPTYTFIRLRNMVLTLNS